MTNDNKDETARLARQWAEEAMRKETRAAEYGDTYLTEEERAAAEQILATTDPLTMADVEWNDEKHRGAGATDTIGKVWIMAENDGDYINCVGLDMSTCGAPAEELTPNGKRYELREIGAPEQPAHPETLVTEQDYENAPVGTIVDIDGTVAVRGWAGWYPVNYLGTRQPEFMSRQGEGDVIRWGGWGK